MENNKRIVWLDGLKYFACIGVYLSHFFGVFNFNNAVTSFDFPESLYSFFNFFRIILNGNFWVCIFCIISGMFCVSKKIESFSVFLKQTFYRYIRFVVPFIFMSAFIVLISLFLGFPTQTYGKLFSNEWLLMFYSDKLTFSDVIKCIFIFDNSENYVLWTITPIFIGNIAIYFMQFLMNKLTVNQKIKDTIIYSVLFAALIICTALKSTLIYSCACCIGAILPKITKLTERIPKKIMAVFFAIIITVFHFHNDIVNLLIPKISLIEKIGADLFYLNTVWHIVYAVVLIILLFNLKTIQKVFSTAFFRKFSFTSFSVYLFHCPIIFSFSLILCGALIKKIQYTGVFFIILISTSILIFLWSFVYEKTVGKLCSSIFIKIKSALKI